MRLIIPRTVPVDRIDWTLEYRVLCGKVAKAGLFNSEMFTIHGLFVGVPLNVFGGTKGGPTKCGVHKLNTYRSVMSHVAFNWFHVIKFCTDTCLGTE